MQKVSYIGDGSTTDFYFNFPFYTNTDIIVLKNNQTATDCTIIGTTSGLNADIPYTGGKVVFNSAPAVTDSITIYRHLPLTRIVDYQPTEKINPTNLNQDMNYMIEILKDMQDKIDMFSEQYNDIVNKESTDNLLSKIDNLNQLINNDEIINKYTSNCITKIQQDLKIELSSGTFTLKAGSKVYIPNGAGNFDTIITTSDLSVKPSSFSTSSNRMVIYTTNGTIGMLDVHLPYVYSGTTAPTTFDNNGRAFWYDTVNNTIKKTSDNGSTWTSGYGFPIALVEITTNIGITAINNIFNGIGYIGSTIYVLPGVKSLIPDGRNIDGTLKNISLTVNSVKTFTPSNTLSTTTNIALGSAEQVKYHSFVYDKDSNTTSAPGFMNAGDITYTNGKITYFNPKTSFQQLDYNDTNFIAHQAMPSHIYTNLTLPASGGTITAPADGYLTVNKSATTSGEYINMINTSNNINVNSIATNAMNCRLLMPVSKGDTIMINYTLTGTTNWFRFVYANSAK